ncbi:acyltransferase, partial [bacterium]
MKIGFVQFAPKLGDIHTNLQKVDDLLKNVSADIIVLPELFATGYLFPDRDF